MLPTILRTGFILPSMGIARQVEAAGCCRVDVVDATQMTITSGIHARCMAGAGKVIIGYHACEAGELVLQRNGGPPCPVLSSLGVGRASTST